MNYLRVKNWDQFQHYKDRNPPWIKLHVCLVDDYEFSALPDNQKGQLMMIWIFASKNDGKLPNDERFLKNKLGLDPDFDLQLLIESGWLENDTEHNEPAEKWASRYISSAIRKELLEQAGNKCQSCESKKDLEIDHIIPVSKGGTGNKDNLQVLCRPCNRRKRVRSTRYADAEQVATQTCGTSVAFARSREAEAEAETEKEKDLSPDGFDVFWAAYPKRVARAKAEKSWRAIKPSPKVQAGILSALAEQKKSDQWVKDGGQFIPHASTWLNQRRWEDEVSGACEAPRRVAV